jgi:triosephosphate isomerase
LANFVGQHRPNFDLVVCPSFVWLDAVRDALDGSSVLLGAQNVHWEENGAFTGQVSAKQLLDLDCRYVMVGHSELRATGETSAFINRKLKTLLRTPMTAILCVGESDVERSKGTGEAAVLSQIADELKGLPNDLVGTERIASNLVVAYEPLWAISRPGEKRQACSPSDAEEMRRALLGALTHIHPALGTIRVLYGGSVNQDNATSFLTTARFDGVLVGEKSTKSETFLPVLRAILSAPVQGPKPTPGLGDGSKRAAITHRAPR